MVTWLLQNGGNPMLFDQIHSRVCLHYAALYGAPQCISALFAEDAFVRMSSGPALLRNAHVLDSQGFHRCSRKPPLPCCPHTIRAPALLCPKQMFSLPGIGS